jgi:hypothetical protein
MSADETKLCEHCGAEFARGARRAFQWRRQRFCSNACGHRTAERLVNVAAKIKALAIPEPNSGCWIWLGALTADGYGDVRVNGRRIRPHRLVIELRDGEPIGGDWALHVCDTRCCVNPDHLYRGDVVANTRDRVARGRSYRGPRLGRQLGAVR